MADNSEGQLRIQCSRGWASVTARDGSTLLARQGRPWTLQLRRIPTEAELQQTAVRARTQTTHARRRDTSAVSSSGC